MSKRLRGRIKTRQHLLQYFDIDYNNGKTLIEILQFNNAKTNIKTQPSVPVVIRKLFSKTKQ